MDKNDALALCDEVEIWYRNWLAAKFGDGQKDERSLATTAPRLTSAVRELVREEPRRELERAALADVPDSMLGDVAGVFRSLLVWADPNMPYWKTDAASGRMMEFATKLAAARGEKA